MSHRKYRLHELASDLGVPVKYLSHILAVHEIKCKNHMQVLDGDMINLLFSYILQNEEECISQRSEHEKTESTHAAVVRWSDTDFYAVLLEDNKPIDRDYLVSQCSNQGYYYNQHEAARNRAIFISLRHNLKTERIEELSIDDYPSVF